MKKIFICAIFVSLLIVIKAISAVTFSNSVTYATISGTPSLPATNSGAWVLIGNARILPPIYSLSHGALAATTDVTNYIQISLGGTNAPVTIGIVSPATTNNNSIESYTPTTQNLPVFTRVVPVTTNSVPVGAQIVLGVNSVQ